MLGKVFMTKYIDLGSPTVNFHINNIPIHNILIDLEDTISLMNKETMEKLKPNLRQLLKNARRKSKFDFSLIKLKKNQISTSVENLDAVNFFDLDCFTQFT